jgi:aspartyl-tRNA(Asn)/glutamyl-tRNA(Gln) amidotransferase subunit A
MPNSGRPVPLDALHTLTIKEFGRLLRTGQVTSEQLTEACLGRIGAHAVLNAFILVTADTARAQAREADHELAAGHDRGPLHGVPISIKDLIDVAGVPTTAASRVRDTHVADHDAPAVAALRRAGAVFVGKTNLHEFAFGTTNEDSAFGPAKNPFAPTRSPGGSSGGSAVSVATGMALASIGTDTGGSIRIPSAACGLVGLKPCAGEVPTAGVVPLSRRLDHLGPLTRTVADARLVYQALLAKPASTPAPVPVQGLQFAVPRRYFCDILDHDVRARFEEALERLRAAGVRITDVEIPHAHLIPSVYQHIVLGDAAAYHADTLDHMPERYTPAVRIRLEMGRYLLAEDYVRALDARDALRVEVNEALEGEDALILPSLAIPAPVLGAKTVLVERTQEPVRNLMLRLTQLFNLTGHAAIALPAGRTGLGLPCSVQLVGPDTPGLLGVAEACEAHINGTAAHHLRP